MNKTQWFITDALVRMAQHLRGSYPENDPINHSITWNEEGLKVYLKVLADEIHNYLRIT